MGIGQIRMVWISLRCLQCCWISEGIYDYKYWGKEDDLVGPCQGKDMNTVLACPVKIFSTSRMSGHWEIKAATGLRGKLLLLNLRVCVLNFEIHEDSICRMTYAMHLFHRFQLLMQWLHPSNKTIGRIIMLFQTKNQLPCIRQYSFNWDSHWQPAAINNRKKTFVISIEEDR